MSKVERERALDERVAFLVQELKKIAEVVEGIKKEVRSVREDLRNLDNIRALRK